MPAEWERHERTFMAWPCRKALWGDAVRLQRARATTACLARAIDEVETVVMVTHPKDASEAERLCGRHIEIVPLPIDDSWIRDSGPVFVRCEGVVAGIDWGFNSWGGKYQPFQYDDELPARLLERMGLPRFKGPMVLEGGAFGVDGAGTLLTTQECLLNPNRNPDLSREAIEERLRSYLGVRHVVWLPYGLEDDDTDGHVDNVAAFAAPGLVLLNWTEDKDDPNYRRMAANERALAAARDACGRAFEIIKLPQPGRETGWHGRRLPRSYINSYVANDAVFAPCFDDPADEAAAHILGACFNAKDVIQLPMDDIVVGGGGIHCVTQQQPALESVR